MPDDAAAENGTVLAEMDRAGAWFHARKTRAIEARRLAADAEVATIEGIVSAKAGDFLCRGGAGDVWPQKAASLEAKYSPDERVDAEGWQVFTPRADAEGVMAAEVARPFHIIATWGRLSGKAGDFVVKNFRDRDVAVPEDVWIVDGRLFQATYERVRE